MNRYTFRTAISGLELSDISIAVDAINIVDALKEWEEIAIAKLPKSGVVRLIPGINVVIKIEVKK